ncbi:Hpt domain-containing protein [Tepidimonas sp.]|uniref:Hpt domain-containing protein n=1 Tax=Tepidimonas sp. TaxID=2002775 RepID=UPI00391A0307
MTSPLINSANLDELLSLLGDEFRDITRLFVEQLEGELADLRAARAAQDWQALYRRAHALKGSSGNMGATALSESAARLERAARDGDADGVEREIAAIELLAPQTVQALRAGRYV